MLPPTLSDVAEWGEEEPCRWERKGLQGPPPRQCAAHDETGDLEPVFQDTGKSLQRMRCVH